MNTSAKFKVNRAETVGGVVWTSIFKPNQGNNSVILDGIFTKCLSCTSTAPNEHFAKSQANWTETVGGLVRTRFSGQTDRPTARP